MKLSYLASPYEGELIYGRFARTKAHLNLTYSGFFELLTGKISDSIGFHFGSNLEKIRLRLPENYFNIEDSIRKNSLLPFIENFVSKELYNNLITSIVYGPSIKASLMTLEFKYCPLCSQFDRQLIGETYWRRTFAVNFWMVCPWHGCYLNTVTPNAFDRGLKSIFYNAEEMIPIEQDSSIRCTRDELEIARRIEEVVTGTRKFCKNKFLNNLLERGLIQRGSFEQRFVSDRDNFIRSISRALPDKAFSVKSMSYQRLIADTDFSRPDPIKLLLTEYFVETRDFSCSTLQKTKIELNDCPCGMESKTLQTFDKYRGSLRTKIVFCSKCSLAYHVTEKGILKSFFDYGVFLRKKVNELIKQKVSIRKIGEQLNLTIDTVIRIKNGKGKRNFVKKFLTKRDEMRKKFEASMHKTHKQKASIHTWLTRYDRDWLYTRPRTVILTKRPHWIGANVIPESILKEASHIKTLPIRRFLGYKYFRNYFGKRLRAMSVETREAFYHSQAESVLHYLKRTSLSYIRSRFEKFGTLEDFKLDTYLESRYRCRKLPKKQKEILQAYLQKEIDMLTISPNCE